MKIVIITSGGDWADASFFPLVAPEGADPRQDREDYLAAGAYHGSKLWLDSWLVQNKGYRRPDESEVVEIDS